MASIGSKSSKRSRQSSAGREVDLHVTNPELFSISPRPGGFLKIRVPPRGEDYDYNLYNDNSEYDEADDCRCSSDPNVCVSLNKDASGNIMLKSRQGQHVKLPDLARTDPGREFRIKRAVESTDWTILGIDESDMMIEISNPIQDTMSMLAVTISTIMMMAAQLADIDDVYFDWATKYLNCIMDDEEEEFNRPPNVQGILNHILFLKMGGQPNGSMKSPKGSPPSSLKKGMDGHGGAGGSAAGGSVGGASGARPGSAGGGGGGSNRPGSAGGGSRGGSIGGGGGSAKAVSISERGPRGVPSVPRGAILTAVKGR